MEFLQQEELPHGDPTRFGGLTTLPLPDVAACIAELRHASDDLCLDGVVIETNADGRYLGNPALAPVLAEIAERGVPPFLHPTSPACFEAVGLARPAPLFEFPVDTARTVVDMIFAGVFDRHPTLKLILPHAGGALPALARRIALLSSMPQMRPAPRDTETVKKIFAGIYYDLAMAGDQESFTALRTIAPVSQIVFGSDFPFQQTQAVQSNIDYFRELKGLNDANMWQSDAAQRCACSHNLLASAPFKETEFCKGSRDPETVSQDVATASRDSPFIHCVGGYLILSEKRFNSTT